MCRIPQPLFVNIGIPLMSYVVLARKLRPSRFDDLIGQETAAQTLRNAVLSDRVAHAFLFTGSRGVGKTSAARILTRAVNCLNPDNGTRAIDVKTVLKSIKTHLQMLSR